MSCLGGASGAAVGGGLGEAEDGGAGKGVGEVAGGVAGEAAGAAPLEGLAAGWVTLGAAPAGLKSDHLITSRIGMSPSLVCHVSSDRK